jgi:hypothetical protein
VVLGEVLAGVVDDPIRAQTQDPSRFSLLQTAVTVTPKFFNSWTAAEPMAPVAP